MNTATIVSVEFVPCKDVRVNGNVTAMAEMSDGTLVDITLVDIVSWYDDELHISKDQLIGLTRQEAISLKIRLDVEYLRS
jgi:hypothetical protein